MTVYVIQRVRQRDRETGEYVFKHDLSDAERYGDIQELLSPTATPHSPGVVHELRTKLEDFDPDEDWILCMGSPVLISWAVAIAVDKTSDGGVRLLQWSGSDRCYHPHVARLFPDC